MVGKEKGWGRRRREGGEGVGEEKGWGRRRSGGREGVGEEKGWGRRRCGGGEGVVIHFRPAVQSWLFFLGNESADLHLHWL